MSLLPVTRAYFIGLLAIATLLWASLSAIGTQLSSTAGQKAKSVQTTSGLSQQQNSPTAVEIAKQVTVRVLTKLGTGSGVVIAHQGQIYTVLTCEHVIADSQGSTDTVLTVDGRTHRARRRSLLGLKGIDLALVEFKSKTPYRVAALGDSNALSHGDRVYASGFPNYHFLQDAIEDTRNWGWKAYKLTEGEVSLLPERSLPEGYRLGYTNEVEQGMSGGPVLSQSGQVVGINGRLKYPLQGIDVFVFADGTRPSVELFRQMEALSWAIPIATFRQRARGLLTQLHVNP